MKWKHNLLLYSAMFCYAFKSITVTPVTIPYFSHFLCIYCLKNNIGLELFDLIRQTIVSDIQSIKHLAIKFLIII
jgi:hypothetical protein